MASTPVRLLSLLGAALLAVAPGVRAADALPEDVRFQTETLLTGLPQPMHLEFAPDGRLAAIADGVPTETARAMMLMGADILFFPTAIGDEPEEDQWKEGDRIEPDPSVPRQFVANEV